MAFLQIYGKSLYNILTFHLNMKLQQMPQGQYSLSLLRAIVRAKGWIKGDIIRVEIDKEGNIVLKK